MLMINSNDIENITLRTKVCIPVMGKECYFHSFNGFSDKQEHLALVFYGNGKKALPLIPLVRVHSECLTGDVFHSGKCDCGEQLRESINTMSKSGGIIIYLRQEGRGIGLYNKLDAYALQSKGYDTFEANNLLNFDDDLRDYKVAAQILSALKIGTINLLSNNPDKLKQLSSYGIKVKKFISTNVYLKPHNQNYLLAKKIKSGHKLNLEMQYGMSRIGA